MEKTNTGYPVKPASIRWVILIAILLVITYCAGMYIRPDKYPVMEIQKRCVTTGFAHSTGHKFLYFYYYKKLFPVATLQGEPEYSPEGAEKEIRQQGDQLIMEYFHWSRLGENARIWAYMPDAWLRGTPENPSIRLFNTVVFGLGIIIMLVGFASAGLAFPGLILAVIMCLTPYFRYEVFGNQNIFALMASGFMLIAGLNLPLTNGRMKATAVILLPVITGAISGFFSEIRGEVGVLAVSAALIYLLSHGYPIWKRLMMIVLMAVAFWMVKQSIRSYFDRKWEEAAEVVAVNGGHVYTGKRIYSHRFWHPVFCGLGDFDTRYGCVWDDTLAYAYALPVMKEKCGIDLEYSGYKYHPELWYDSARLYYVKFDEIDEYEEVIREKVLNDITSDPRWYAGILAKRTLAVMTHTLPFEYAGWLLIPVAVILWIRRSRIPGVLLIASLPLSFTPLLIFSGGNNTYNSFFPLLSLALLISIPANILFHARKGAGKDKQ
ncbi:MAG: hypothetical protein JW861_01940 [Bacteroidales bacterium]|nr:hypothetical protein [Bacteroidales bacterium]